MAQVQNPTRFLFWSDLILCQAVGGTWGLVGLLAWAPQPAWFLVWLLFTNGCFYLAKGLGWVTRLRRGAPNPLLWPVLYVHSAAFLAVATVLTLVAQPPMLFVILLTTTVLLTPFALALLVALTLQAVLGYDLVTLTAAISTSLQTNDHTCPPLP